MEVENEQAFKLRLKLNAEETLYLKSLMQNYAGEDPQNETENENKLRMQFWEGLPDLQKLERIVQNEKG